MAQAIKFDSEIYWRRMGGTVLKELEGWKKHPELSKIVHRMESFSKPDQFLDTFAEYAIARRFFQSGCEIAVEVPTANGRTADIKAWSGATCLFAHVKRLNLDETHSRQEKIVPLFAPLEKIKRPIHIELRLRPDITYTQAMAAVNLAKPFILQAVKGDQVVLRYGGVELGSAYVLGDTESGHAAIWVHHGMQECTDHQRMRKKLSQAYEQFMPGSTNIIFLAWYWATDYDLLEFENNLLGSTWGTTVFDANMRPMTVEEGRKPNGFWSEGRHPDSQAACCFRPMITTGEIDCKVWIRPGSEGKIPSWFHAVVREIVPTPLPP